MIFPIFLSNLESLATSLLLARGTPLGARIASDPTSDKGGVGGFVLHDV